jgi:monoamine oxidase
MPFDPADLNTLIQVITDVANLSVAIYEALLTPVPPARPPSWRTTWIGYGGTTMERLGRGCLRGRRRLRGAGGGAAARGRGARVVVLEARDRVGGRTWNWEMPDGLSVSVGGTWLGVGQERMFQLCKDVGVDTYEQFSHGDHLVRLDDTNVRYHGSAVPKRYLVGLGGYALAMRRLSRMADRLPLERPWEADGAEELDARTLSEWMSSRRNVPSKLGRELTQMAMRVLFCTDPAELSVLGALSLPVVAQGPSAVRVLHRQLAHRDPPDRR